LEFSFSIGTAYSSPSGEQVNIEIPESLRAYEKELAELAKVYSVARRRSALPIILGIDWGIKRDGRKRLMFGNKVVA
jgi:hypothetical protein